MTRKNKLVLYHGTTEKAAKKIEAEGFKTDKRYNWQITSKPGYVYLSSAYAPFYAMYASEKDEHLALVKCLVKPKFCYPEDDFIMYCHGKKKYNQEELDAVNIAQFKHLWRKSLEFMGNVAVKPADAVEVLGARCFDGKNLIMKCDPVISPMNFKFMGEYYKALTAWLYEDGISI